MNTFTHTPDNREQPIFGNNQPTTNVFGFRHLTAAEIQQQQALQQAPQQAHQQAQQQAQQQAHQQALAQQQPQTVRQWVRQERQLYQQQEQRDIPYITHQICNLGNWNCPRHPTASLATSGDQWACTSCGECGGRRF